jgi:anti-anti-sigma factor
MALLPGTLSRAGPLSSVILDLQVTQDDPAVCVVTVVGEIDALTAPEFAAFATAQLIETPVVMVNLDGVRFLSSAGLRALLEANEFATREDRALCLACNSQTVNWALDATGLREHFTFTDNVPCRTGPDPSCTAAPRCDHTGARTPPVAVPVCEWGQLPRWTRSLPMKQPCLF